jgi:hypothetical protein
MIGKGKKRDREAKKGFRLRSTRIGGFQPLGRFGSLRTGQATETYRRHSRGRGRAALQGGVSTPSRVGLQAQWRPWGNAVTPQIDGSAALEAPLFHGTARIIAPIDESFRPRTLQKTIPLFPAHPLCRSSRADSAAHCVTVPACGPPGSCFRERGATLHQSSDPPTVRESCLQEENWRETP